MPINISLGKLNEFFFDKLRGTNETVVIMVVIAMGVFGFFIFRGAENEYSFVCPSDFTDREEYIDSVDRWVSEYQKDYPDANSDKIMVVRDRLIEKYGCGSGPSEVTEGVEEEIDVEKLIAGIKYAESQREDEAADDVIKTTSEKEFYDNPYIKHLRTAFNGYLEGTNNGVEEGVAEKSKLESELKCGLGSFDKSYFKSNFNVIEVERNDYGGIVAYIAFSDKPDRVFWAWIYQYGGGDYTLRGFCEYAALIPQG